MADTAHKSDAELVEHHDAPAVLAAKIDELAALVRAAKHAVLWTGAGISTSTGIPDFRGPNGKWTLAAQKKTRDPTLKTVRSTLEAVPSVTHRAIVALLRSGHFKKIISSNTDGLHRRSGVHPDDIVELHGNSNRARCNKCAAYVYADARVRGAKNKVHDHSTPFVCPKPGCTGKLEDTIINFGEYLHDEVVDRAERFGKDADLLIVLGSSLRVITCEALEHIKRKGRKLVIVNLQTTPYDSGAALRVFSETDAVMTGLLERLDVPIAPLELQRFATVAYDAAEQRLTWQGHDEHGCRFGFARAVAVRRRGATVSTAAAPAAAFNPLQLSTVVAKAGGKPKAAPPRGDTTTTTTAAAAAAAANTDLELVMHPWDWRSEPECAVPLVGLSPDEDWRAEVRMTYAYDTRSWTVATADAAQTTRRGGAAAA